MRPALCWEVMPRENPELGSSPVPTHALGSPGLSQAPKVGHRAFSFPAGM